MTATDEVFRQNLRRVLGDIQNHCQNKALADRNLTVVAVSKMRSAQEIRSAYLAGQRDFGENYVQELLSKMTELKNLAINWHLIGHLQRNKVKDVVGKISLIQTLDSERLALSIDKIAKELGIIQNCLVQVKIADDDTEKTGLAKHELMNFLKHCKTLKHICIKGLMAVGSLTTNPQQTQKEFSVAQSLFESAKTIMSEDFCELSLGMSGDYGIAINSGSTMIRLGTSLFGAR